MTVTIRPLGEADLANWVDMRVQLWPQGSAADHRRDVMEQFLVASEARAFGAARDGSLIGLIEISLRNYAEGCTASPVPFVEGIWVDPAHRQKGIGTQMVDHVAALLRMEGHRELGSDADIANLSSQQAHLNWGFAEVARVVSFRRDL